MFSATLIAGTHALRSGSSGRLNTPCARICAAGRAIRPAVDEQRRRRAAAAGRSAPRRARAGRCPRRPRCRRSLPAAPTATRGPPPPGPRRPRRRGRRRRAATRARASQPPVRAACASGISRLPTIISAIAAGVRSATRPLAGEAPAPEHRHRVGERHHLAELVGDHQHGDLAGAGHGVQHAEHLVGLAGGEHRGRLVEDHDAPRAGRAASGSRPSASRPPRAARPGASRSSAERHRGHERGEALALLAPVDHATGTSSRAMTRFSATVMLGTSVKCW